MGVHLRSGCALVRAAVDAYGVLLANYHHVQRLVVVENYYPERNTSRRKVETLLVNDIIASGVHPNGINLPSPSAEADPFPVGSGNVR